MRRAALPALVLLVAGWALTFWVAPWSDERVNDLFVYRAFAEPVLDGGLPYRDVAFEYPPLAATAIALPGLAGTGEETFRWAFALWTLGAALAVVLLCGALAPVTGGDARRAMLAAALMPALLGALVRTHFDLFPVALLLVGLLLLARERPRAGLAMLGLGAMTKAFPLAAVPLALAWLVARGRRREAWQGGLACAAVIAVVAAAAVAASPDGAMDAVRYHLDRPAQIESSPALVLLGLDAAGAGEARSVSSHRSDGLLHPATDAVTSLFLTAFVALVTLLCVGVAGRARLRDRGVDRGARGVDRGARELVIASLAACAAVALFGKVLSPQFMIWVLPLGALAFAWRLHALAAAVALAAVLTQIEFPAHYFDVVAREPLAIALVVLRNLALLAVVVLSVRALEPRRHEQLRDGRRPALAVRID
jgi:Glycosyltransferase family 87